MEMALPDYLLATKCWKGKKTGSNQSPQHTLVWCVVCHCKSWQPASRVQQSSAIVSWFSHSPVGLLFPPWQTKLCLNCMSTGSATDAGNRTHAFWLLWTNTWIVNWILSAVSKKCWSPKWEARKFGPIDTGLDSLSGVDSRNRFLMLHDRTIQCTVQ